MGKYGFRPVLGQCYLGSGIRLMTDLREKVQWSGEEKVDWEEVSCERERRGVN